MKSFSKSGARTRHDLHVLAGGGALNKVLLVKGGIFHTPLLSIRHETRLLLFSPILGVNKPISAPEPSPTTNPIGERPGFDVRYYLISQSAFSSSCTLGSQSLVRLASYSARMPIAFRSSLGNTGVERGNM